MSAYFASSRGLASRMVPRSALSPLAQELFGAYEPGSMYDPEITGTLYQDAAGTTPVTAVEQPVGLMLDLSGRGNHALQATTTKRPVYSRRVNVLLNTENQSAWSLSGSRFTAGVTDGTGAALLTASVQSSVLAGVHTDYPVGTSYANPACFVRSIEVKAGTATHFSFGSAGNLVILRLSDGVIEYSQNLTTATVTSSDDGYWRIELLTENLTWAASSLSNYISWGKGRSGSSISTTDQIGSTVYVRRPSYVVKEFGFRGEIPYQRVTTATDYDADPAKFPAYLRFDGVDDALQTGNIDFTSTDKMTVWAGYAKLNDGPQSIFLETGANYTGGGGIGMFASNGGSTAFGISHSDTSGNKTVNFVSAATEVGVVTARYNLQAGEKTSIRKDSGAWSFASAASGGGMLGNRPLYIGARAGTSLYFNGRLYSLIVRGAQTPLSQIEAAELYIKQKMRMP